MEGVKIKTGFRFPLNNVKILGGEFEGLHVPPT